MKLYVSVGNSRMDKRWNGLEMELKDFADRLSHTNRTAETVEQYKKMTKAQQDSIKDVGGFVLGKLKGGRRKKDTVVSRSAITLDMDYGTPDIIDELEMLHDMHCIVYATHKHTAENPRLRVILPLTREVTPDEYAAVARKIADAIGIELFDDSTYEPSRLMYWPSTSSDGEFIFKEIEGQVVNPDTVLASYTDWHDASSWPVSTRQETIVNRTISKQSDPLTKGGIIGAFNRTYSVTAAIDRFIPDVYRPSAMTGRYDYVPADSSAGVVIYEDRFAYSHHSTDPCCGKLMNAFDVVRLHKFGDLDAKASEDTDSAKLPSFKAMQEFASKQEAVKETLVKEREKAAKSDFEDTSNGWQTKLDIDRQGKIKDTLSNIALVVRYDKNLKSIVYNQLKNCVDVVGELPWKQVKNGWGDTDLACAKLYFEKVYGLWSPSKFKDALLAVISSERLYHPIKEYFETLTWDGVERVDTLLINYLGAEDTPYVRAVTRKTIVAAVARVFEPGIKFDSILVLNGPQGIGKSTFFSILGREWYSDSLSISDMKDKTAAEKLQGYWILELGELAGIKKVDVEVVKGFVTRTDDKFRQSYGVNVESHPRTCIIVGSTNSEGGFLRDVTGNRRFWPVHVSGKGKYHAWELREIDQIWAEAIHKYHEGEALYLTGKEAAEAYAAQQDAMESDDREGIIIDYLNRLLPIDWDKMDLYQRRAFLGGGEFETSGLTGVVERDRCCVMEIWCECFGKERQNLKKIDSYEIEGIINKIGGWSKYEGSKSGKSRIPQYGIQKTFFRVSEETDGNK
ncbi:putative P-loop ATPase [Kineothrix alysoides]|uniref:Putative P-loop ATPase n=1 Tax=Kineothrix alysoides TaxID=1469948 RepID=A0A4R1R4Y5_9FIRM|nr:virulence-associated E family protein [Kineothrix alysoides]TCL60554.1 putative P-loop ATPase [Kineothrix alysoides]